MNFVQFFCPETLARWRGAARDLRHASLALRVSIGRPSLARVVMSEKSRKNGQHRITLLPDNAAKLSQVLCSSHYAARQLVVDMLGVAPTWGASS